MPLRGPVVVKGCKGGGRFETGVQRELLGENINVAEGVKGRVFCGARDQWTYGNQGG